MRHRSPTTWAALLSKCKIRQLLSQAPSAATFFSFNIIAIFPSATPPPSSTNFRLRPSSQSTPLSSNHQFNIGDVHSIQLGASFLWHRQLIKQLILKFKLLSALPTASHAARYLYASSHFT